jgi:iron complex transport system substrate-binding protein
MYPIFSTPPPHLIADTTVATIRLKKPAQRIVCLTATGFDVLSELGLEPVGGSASEVAEQPEFYGKKAETWPRVGSWLWPSFKTLRSLQPDLILAWQFPHRFYQSRLAQIAPVYLMGGSGYEAAVLRMLDVASLTGKMAAAEAAFASLERQLHTYRHRLQTVPPKTVAVMGGSTLNRLVNRYPVETETGTLGSLLRQFTHFPWAKPDPNRGEPGLTYLSLEAIAANDPDVILVQSYAPTAMPLSQQLAGHRVWRSLKAFQTQQIHEIPQYWHWGNGTRLMRVMVEQVLPLIYPDVSGIGC